MSFFNRRKPRETENRETLGLGTRLSRFLAGLPLSHILVIVMMGIVVPILIALSFADWRATSPDVAGRVPERSIDTGTSPAKESEADAIKKAIDSKPIELRQTLSDYAQRSEDIKRILSQGLESRNIGGAVAVAITNLEKNADREIDSVEQLGFYRIDDDNALVNQVLKGAADITTVIVSSNGNHLFKVTIEMKNNTAYPLTCIVPKGQLVEIKNGRNESVDRIVNASYQTAGLPQVPAKADDKDKGGVTVVPPWEPAKIEFIAYCANPNLPTPRGRANLAIYALGDTSYKTWRELRDIRTKKLNL